MSLNPRQCLSTSISCRKSSKELDETVMTLILHIPLPSQIADDDDNKEKDSKISNPRRFVQTVKVTMTKLQNRV